MVWQSREGKLPPPQFLAEVVAYLQRAYGINPSRELLELLYPFFVEEWRNGATAREAANATCSCKKGEIVPSPATAVELKKGEVRPPRGAKRGDVFGSESLRSPGSRDGTKVEPPSSAVPKTRKARTTITKRTAAPKAEAAPTPIPSPPSAELPPSAAAMPTADAQNAAMLSAIQALLPSVASQLSKEMAKKGEG